MRSKRIAGGAKRTGEHKSRYRQARMRESKGDNKRGWWARANEQQCARAHEPEQAGR